MFDYFYVRAPKNMRRPQGEPSVQHFGQSMPLPKGGALYRRYSGNSVSQHVNRKVMDHLNPESFPISNTVERRNRQDQFGRRRRKNRFSFAPHQQAIKNKTPTSAMMLNNVPAMKGSIQTNHGKVVMENDIIHHQPIIEFAPNPINGMKNTVAKPVNRIAAENDGRLTEYPNGDIVIKAPLGHRKPHQHHRKQHVTTTEDQSTTTETIKEIHRIDNVDEDDKRYNEERRRIENEERQKIENEERRKSENEERERLQKVKQDDEANERKLEMQERDRIHKERQELMRLHEEERLRVEQEIKKREQEDADYFQQQEDEKRRKQEEEAQKLQKIKEKEEERNKKRQLAEERRLRAQEIQRQQEEEAEHQTQTSSPSERRSFEDERKSRRDRLRERLQKLSPEQQKQFFELRRERMKRKHDDKHYNDSFIPE